MTISTSTPWIVSLVAGHALALALSLSDAKVLAVPPRGGGETPAQEKEASPRRRLEGNGSKGVASLAFSPDGKYLIAGGRDGPTALVWDLTTGKVRYELHPHGGGGKDQGAASREGPVLGVAYSPDGKLIATGRGYQPSKPDDLAKILLWDSATGKLLREIPAHRDGVYAVAFSPDGKQLVSGGGEDTAKVWDVASGREVQRFLLDSRSDRVDTVAFSPDGKSILVGSAKGEFLRGEVNRGRVVSRSRLTGTRIPPLFQVSPDSKALIRLEGGARGPLVRVRSFAGGKENILWQQPSAEHAGASPKMWAASPDGKALALFDPFGVSVWSLVTGKKLLSLYPERSPFLNVLAFSPDGKTLAAGLLPSMTILLWDVSGPRLDDLWAKAAVAGGAEAKDCVTDFAALPDEAVPYLAGRLRRLAKIEEQVRKIAAGLDDDNFQTREKASQQLGALGTDAAFGLERVLENKPSPEVRKRIEELLAAPAPPPVDPKKLNKTEYLLWLQGKWPPKAPEAAKPSEARAVKRAFAALEKMGTAEARQLVKELAETAPDGLVREEARALLQRLSQPKSPRP